MDNTAREYWSRWLWASTTTRLMTVNIIVWAVVGLGYLLAPAGLRGAWVSLFAMPSAWSAIAHRAWTPLTYMFTHLDFLHLVANMLWLLLFGEVYEQTQGGRRLVALYVLGGLGGALAFALWPMGARWMLGASCAVMAVVGAVAVLQPERRVGLLLFGQVKLIWIAVAAAVFFVVLVSDNAERVAHGAAAVVGVAYALLRRRGVDITVPLLWLFALPGSQRRRKQPRLVRGLDYLDDEAQLDALLDKVGRSGYSSLSAHERQRLFDLSQRFNRR